MIRKHSIPNRRARPGGFTMIEMLVVVSVILMLAGMTLAGMSYVRQEARIARTKSTIAKIHQLIMEKWDSYDTRRVPIDMTGLTAAQQAEVRQKAIWYLQQFEMPDRIADFRKNLGTTISVPYSADNTVVPAVPAGTKSMPYPRVVDLYEAALTRDWPNTSGTIPGKPDKQPPTIPGAMLYMVCTMNNPDALEMFTDGEVGDFDGDGWPEFLDGWGHPIYWLRWAPAFPGSKDPTNGAFIGYPLIYSAGPDWHITPDNANVPAMRGYGFDAGSADASGGRMPADPNAPAYANVGGQASDSEEVGARFDNITNHNLDH